jgi:hypothetical protein
MVLELRTNRAVLLGLTNWFSVFVFTGGHVPAAPCSLAATTSYLQHPSAADGFSVSQLERYRCLVQTIGDLGQTAGGPRTWKCRHSLGDRFGLAAAELRTVTDGLEASMAKAMQQPKE